MTRYGSFVTLSKYPPYRSGHAHQALWNNRALAELTGAVQHQVTYCGMGTDPAEDAGPRVRVHHVAHRIGNDRVPDGHLLRALSAQIVRLATQQDVEAVLTYYVDPHAAVVNRAVRTLRHLGRAPVVMHSVEGSDVLNSMCAHVDDGEAALLVSDVMESDVLCSVSRYTSEEFLRVVAAVAGPAAHDRVAEAIRLRYPGLPPEAFVAPAHEVVRAFRAKVGLRPDSTVVSTIGRLAPEKGLDTVFALAECAEWQQPDWEFVIAGTGPLAADLERRAEHTRNVRVLPRISASDAHSLRATSGVGVFPTRMVPGFVETFCISALEYEALGVPVLATAIGGLPEATPNLDSLVPTGGSVEQWWARLTVLLATRRARGEVAARFAAGFTSAASAARIVELLAEAGDRLTAAAR